LGGTLDVSINKIETINFGKTQSIFFDWFKSLQLIQRNKY